MGHYTGSITLTRGRTFEIYIWENTVPAPLISFGWAHGQWRCAEIGPRYTSIYSSSQMGKLTRVTYVQYMYPKDILLHLYTFETILNSFGIYIRSMYLEGAYWNHIVCLLGRRVWPSVGDMGSVGDMASGAHMASCHDIVVAMLDFYGFVDFNFSLALNTPNSKLQ